MASLLAGDGVFSLCLVSALGCINKLVELFMVKVGLVSIKLDDNELGYFGDLH